jgi:putative membrane protein
MGGLETAYLLAVGRGGLREPGGRRRAILFSLGMLTLWVGANWPMHDLAEGYLYSVHMVQHLLFSLVAPPLLIAGLPARMVRAMLRPEPVFALVRFLTKPVVALVLFNAVVVFTHWPAVVEASVRSEGIHFALHLLIVASALVMWWPVMSPLPELPPLTPPLQMLYLFFQSLAPTIPASFLTFGSRPLYPVYATFPRIWGISVMSDQLVAGLIMKLAGGAILWGFITVIFFRWHDRESRDGLDATAFRNVDRDLRTELARR